MSRHHNPAQKAVLEAANTESLDAIMEVVERHVRDFEPVTLATCLHRIAKVCKLRPASSNIEAKVRSDERFHKLLETIRKQCRQLDARGLANVIWAFGSLAFRDDELLLSLAEGSRGHLQKFLLQNLSNVAWALARLQFRHDALFSEMAQHCRQRSEQMTTQDICSLLWAYDAFGLTEAHLDLFEVCMRRLTVLVRGPWTSSTTTPHTTSLAYSALAIADNVHLFIPTLVDDTFEAILAGVRLKLKMVTPQDFCRYLTAFAKTGRADELSVLFEPIAAALEQSESKQKLDSDDVAMLFWALGASRMSLTRGDIGEFASSTQSYATKLARELPEHTSLQDLAAIAWGLASARLVCAPRLFETLAQRTLALLDRRDRQLTEHKQVRALCGILWSFAASGLRHAKLFSAVADILSRSHATVAWKDLVDAIWACAFADLPQEQLLATVAGRATAWESQPGGEVTFASRVQVAWAFAVCSSSNASNGAFDVAEVVAGLLPEASLAQVIDAEAEQKDKQPQYIWPLLLQVLASQRCLEGPTRRARMDKVADHCRGLQRERPLELLYKSLWETLSEMRVKPVEYESTIDKHFFVNAALPGYRVAIDVAGPELTVLDVTTREAHLNGVGRLKHRCLQLSGWRVGFVTWANFGSAGQREPFLQKLLRLDSDADDRSAERRSAESADARPGPSAHRRSRSLGSESG